MSSAEPVVVPKKRGRPRKVVPEIEAVEILEVPKKSTTTTTRAKSTKVVKPAATTSTTTKKASTSTTVKAAPKSPAKPPAVKAAPAKPVKTPTPTASIATPPPSLEPTKKTPAPSKPVSVSADKQTSSSTPVAVGADSKQTKGVAKPRPIVYYEPIPAGKVASSPTAKSPVAEKPIGEELGQNKVKPAVVTPETSKIISKVRELPKNPFEASATLSNPTESSSTQKTTAGKVPIEPAATKASAKSPTKPKTPASPLPSNPSKALPPSAPKPKLPIAALNSAIVSDISSRAGAKPNTSGNNPLPSNYKTTARKVTTALVAMPILLVTSYVLYQRLIMGEERKLLVAPSATPVEIAYVDNKPTEEK